MPFMQRTMTLLDRPLPEGVSAGAIANVGDRIDIVQGTESGGWVKVRRVGLFGEGFVRSEIVGDASPVVPDDTMDSDDLKSFYRMCWLKGLAYNITPHYLVAVAKLRCGAAVDNATKDGTIGPFRLTQTEWDANRQTAAFGLTDYIGTDIRDWARQCTLFAAMASRDLSALKTGIERQPSAGELYIAQLIGIKAAVSAIKTPASTTSEALNVQASDLPLGDLDRAQIMDKYAKYLRDVGPPVADAKCSAALDRIADDLQKALDAVKEDVKKAGGEILGVDPEADDTISDSKRKIPNTSDFSGGNTGAINGAGGPLGELISKGEGGYGSFNRGRAGDAHGAQLDPNMSLQDILAKQSLPAGNPNRLFAVGKYQIIPKTMRGAIKTLELDTSQKYGPQLQEFIFRNYLVGAKRPQVRAYVAGTGTSTHAAQLALAQEFASVANPDSLTEDSFYAGSANNRASITKAATIAALQAERELYRELVKQNSPADAWTKLSA